MFYYKCYHAKQLFLTDYSSSYESDSGTTISAKEEVNMRWAGLVLPALQVHTTRLNTTETNEREAARWAGTTLDLHNTTGLITVGFVRTGSDVPLLPVMSLKMRK